MKKPIHTELSRRERQIMDILYRYGRAGASEVMKELPGNLNDSTVRTHLRILEEKGHIRHEEQGLRYVYLPTAHSTFGYPGCPSFPETVCIVPARRLAGGRFGCRGYSDRGGTHTFVDGNSKSGVFADTAVTS
jgi:hypothetical protein